MLGLPKRTLVAIEAVLDKAMGRVRRIIEAVAASSPGK